MSVLIKGMEMPKNCSECRFCRPKGPYPCNCYAGDFLIKPSETDLKDGLCPLKREPSWNLVTERLPEEDGFYLVTEIVDGKLETDMVRWEEWDKDGETFGFCVAADVLAWMPLPDPWRGEEK